MSPVERRLRRLLSPFHPQKLWSRARWVAHLLGWHHVKLWLSGLRPSRLVASWAFVRSKRSEFQTRAAEPRLTVAVDISPFWEPLTGIGWYLYRLLQAMSERDDVRLRLYGPGLLDKGDVPEPVVPIPEGPALERVTHRIPENFSVVWYWLTDRLRPHEERIIALDGNRILFAPNYFLPARFGRCDGKLVATIHDLSFMVVPETMRESTRLDLEKELRHTAERCSMVLTDSEAVRQEIVDAGLTTLDTVRAVHLAPGSTEGVGRMETPGGLPERYVLFVGTVEPRKNLETLLSAFEAYRKTENGQAETPLSLVLCGGMGWKTEAILERIEKACADGWCVRLGYVSEEELKGTYAAAEWLALPSLYEGFGLPAVEAMAVGVPLLLSDIPILREVGGDAALYAPPKDVDAWTDLLRRIHGERDLRGRQAGFSAARAKKFVWSKTADATVDVWREASGREALGRRSLDSGDAA